MGARPSGARVARNNLFRRKLTKVADQACWSCTASARFFTPSFRRFILIKHRPAQRGWSAPRRSGRGGQTTARGLDSEHHRSQSGEWNALRFSGRRSGGRIRIVICYGQGNGADTELDGMLPPLGIPGNGCLDGRAAGFHPARAEARDLVLA